MLPLAPAAPHHRIASLLSPGYADVRHIAFASSSEPPHELDYHGQRRRPCPTPLGLVGP